MKEDTMPHVPCDGLLDNCRRAIALVAESIASFEPEQWNQGISSSQVPSRVAFHIVDCLDFYFYEDTSEQYVWGHRFGGGWWDLPEDRLPSQEDLLAYLKEVEERIVHHFDALSDEELSTPYDEERRYSDTRLAHYVHALRHTMHHHGALSLLSLYHGNEKGTWA
jgi:uncharacterized damage-inducible protein DinB